MCGSFSSFPLSIVGPRVAWHTEVISQQSCKRKEPCDMNEIAFDLVRSRTSGKLSPVERQKNPAAVALDRLDGLSVGESPRGALVARKRTEMARGAVRVPGDRGNS